MAQALTCKLYGQKDASMKHLHSNAVRKLCRSFHTVSVGKDEGRTLYYVFESATGGILIASADDRTQALLGYTDNGSYDTSLKNDAFREWMEEYKERLANLQDETEGQLLAQDASTPSKVTNFPQEVAPLLGDIAWGLSAPFGNDCPQSESGRTYATGCAATALAQVMKYYRWPERGTGTNSYKTSTLGLELSADFSLSAYDWDNMLDKYGTDYTEKQAASVAHLLHDVGIAFNTNYNTSSGTLDENIMPRLAEHFSYDKGMVTAHRIYYTTDEWATLLKKELAAGQPVPLFAMIAKRKAGHAFVLDGYDHAGLFHVNWGWESVADGYFDISYMAVENVSYSVNGKYNGYQRAIIGMKPDYSGKSKATEHIVVSDPIYEDEGQLFFSIRNMGCEPYTGECGFVAVAGNDTIAEWWKDVEELAFWNTNEITCDLPALGLTAEKLAGRTCRIFPALRHNNVCDIVKSPVSWCKYVAAKYDGERLPVLDADSCVSQLKVVDLKVVGPRYSNWTLTLEARVTNAHTATEYTGLLALGILDNSGMRASALDMVFLSPGDTAIVRFNISSGLTQGDYRAYVLKDLLNNYFQYISTDKAIDFTLTKDATDCSLFHNIAYFDYQPLTGEYRKGEEAQVRFNAKNFGLEATDTYCYRIERQCNDSTWEYTDQWYAECRLSADTIADITICGKLDYEPGAYRAEMTEKCGSRWCVVAIDETGEVYSYFTITPSTGLTTPITSNGQTHIYDLLGRPARTEKNGVYIINGKRVMVK